MLDEKGEHLLSLASRFSSTPNDAYAALSTADMKHPTVTAVDRREVTLTYGQYRAILATNRNQADRAAAFDDVSRAVRRERQHLRVALQRACCSATGSTRRRAATRTTLDAALHGNNIPTAVVENLIETTKAGTEPLRRYHRLRKRVLGLDTYHAYDATIPLVDFDRQYPYEDVLDWLPASVAPLGADYQRQMRGRAGRRLDRRLREPGQAQRRLLGAGVRRAPVHAAELQRHARRRVHAGARDGALDAHAPLARAPAVRLLGLHDLRRRGAVHAERGALPRLHAGAAPPTSASASSCCSTRSTASSAPSTRR